MEKPNAPETLLRSFQNCTLPRSEWTHAAHLTIALWYLVNYPQPEATQRIRAGIQRYNAAIGLQTTQDSGYHETLTLFWTHTVHQFVIKQGICGFTSEAVAQLTQAYQDPAFPLQYYSRDRLFSWAARREWVEPDLEGWGMGDEGGGMGDEMGSSCSFFYGVISHGTRISTLGDYWHTNKALRLQNHSQTKLGVLRRIRLLILDLSLSSWAKLNVGWVSDSVTHAGIGFCASI